MSHKTMQAEVISIGDEITTGQRLDTNSQWLSLQLADLGIQTIAHTTIADDLHAIRHAFQIAASRAEIVVCSGGLGPTADDLTRQALADAMGVPLQLDDASLAHIRQLFASRRRAMPERNEIQAYFPKGSIPIPNPHGSAPGIFARMNIAIEDRSIQETVGSTEEPQAAQIFCLPGVPAEMKEMWQATVMPQLLQSLGGRQLVMKHRELRCFGAGESDIEQRLPDLIERGRIPTVGITASRATITLRITATAPTESECDALIAPTEQTIRECLGDLVFGTGQEELPDILARQLAERSQTLATIELGTHGLLALGLADLRHDREVVKGSLVFADADQASSWLAHTINSPIETRPNEAEWLEILAIRTREMFQADFCLVVGTIIPTNESGDLPEHLHVGFVSANQVQIERRLTAGHPDIIRPRAAKQALDLLRLYLNKQAAV
jgi:nicotinamide-nucleotide amidase